ncbi:MAG TPA: hypothetical protein VHZ76_01380 [Gammaproteobacteria bacterium]|jgi:hypothetical protein|nr:hypothetical protein [Gammaproteobacteria bacterium]
MQNRQEQQEQQEQPKIVKFVNGAIGTVVGASSVVVFGMTGYDFGKRIVASFDNKELSVASGSIFAPIAAIANIGISIVGVYSCLDGIEKWVLVRCQRRQADKNLINYLLIPGFLISVLAVISIADIAYNDLIAYSASLGLAIYFASTTAVARVSICTKSISDILQDIPFALRNVKEYFPSKEIFIKSALLLAGLISSSIFFSNGYEGLELMFGMASSLLGEIAYDILAALSCVPIGLLQAKSMMWALNALLTDGKDNFTTYNILVGILGLLSTSFVCEIALKSVPGIWKYFILPLVVASSGTTNTRGLIQLKELVQQGNIGYQPIQDEVPQSEDVEQGQSLTGGTPQPSSSIQALNVNPSEDVTEINEDISRADVLRGAEEAQEERKKINSNSKTWYGFFSRSNGSESLSVKNSTWFERCRCTML